MAIHAQWVWGNPGTGKTATIAAEGYNAAWMTTDIRRPFVRCAGKTTMVIDNFVPPDGRVLQILRQVLFKLVPSSIAQLIIISEHPIEECLPASLASHFIVRHFTVPTLADDDEWTLV